jgi:hypothetical protein
VIMANHLHVGSEARPNGIGSPTILRRIPSRHGSPPGPRTTLGRAHMRSGGKASTGVSTRHA